jgi:hypothetical protein
MSIGAKAGVIFRRIGGRVIPILKNVGIGTVAGGAAGHFTSDSLGAESGRRSGAKIGAAVGIIASIPPRPVGRAIKHFATRYWAGEKVYAAANKASKTTTGSSVLKFKKLIK